jgi:uncharacterized membrane protein YeaQ/YmgE (transglycosylase-associated protein family)
MNDAYGVLGHPGMGLITMLIIGAIAGWIAEKVTASDHGLLTNILVGIAGAFLGGKLADVLHIEVFGFFRVLMAATVGAIIVLWVWQALRRQS